MKLRRTIDPNRCTLIEACFLATGSYVRAAKVHAFITAWAIVRRDLGRDPSIEEYAEWWRMSRRQGFYEQARFREAFPDLADPGPLLAAAEAVGENPSEPADFAALLPA